MKMPMCIKNHLRSIFSGTTIRLLKYLGLAAVSLIPLTGMGGSVVLVQPENESIVVSALDPFIASASDPEGLSQATRYLGAVQEMVWSGSDDIDDTQISADTPTLNAGSDSSINIDGLTPHAHGLIRFNELDTLIPPGATILSAVLEVDCSNVGSLMTAYRLLEDWDEHSATWNERLPGIVWSEVGAEGLAHASTGIEVDCTATGLRTVDITSFVQEWVNGAANYGLLLTDGGDDGVDIYSSETGTGPILVVEYALLAVDGAPVNLSGTTALVDFGPSFGLETVGLYAWDCCVENTLGEVSWPVEPGVFFFDTGYPDFPQLVAPLDAATDVSRTPTLQVLVSDPDAQDTLDVTFYGHSVVPGSDPFTIIVLPDSQKYVLTDGLEEIWYTQTQWIADHIDSLNIVFVSHEGDVVETESDTAQWEEAVQGILTLDVANVPYGIAPGNHDITGVSFEDATAFNTYFPYTDYEGLSWYGGHYPFDSNENNYQLFSAGGMDFIALNLTFWPDNNAVAWANDVLQNYSDRVAMITTHGYLDTSANRTVPTIGSTEYLWTDLIEPNPNVHFVFCGHVHGESMRTDLAGASGFEREVHQLLADYQERPDGGEGYLRIMQFVPDENKVYVQTYSPWLDAYLTDADSEFELDFPMNGFEELGTVSGLANGAIASFDWAGLEFGKSYEWMAVATDSSGRSSQGPSWSFTLMDDPGNSLPTAADQNLTVAEDGNVAFGLVAADPDGDTLIFSILNPPQYGTLSGTVPNLTYAPQADYNGADSFTFSVDDGRGGAASASVSITVTPVNDAPTSPSLVSASSGDGVVELVWQASADVDNDSLTYAVIRDGAVVAGSLVETSYQDNDVVNGTEYLYTIRAEDSLGAQAYSETVSATPQGFDPNAYVIQNPTLVYGALQEGDYSSLDPLDAGTQTLSETKIGVVGLLEAQYTLYSPADFATINGNLRLVLDAVFSTPDDGVWAVSAWNCVNSAWDPVLTLTESPVSAMVDLAPSTYMSSDGKIQVAITDGAGRKKEKLDSLILDTLYVLVPTGEPNVAPVAESQSVQTDEDVAAAIVLGATDSDDGPMPLSYSISSEPSHGVLSGTAPNLIYTPAADFSGIDSFTFVASDGMLESDPVVVAVTVVPVNDAPVALPQSLVADVNTALSLTLSATDADQDSLVYRIINAPLHGALSGTAPNLTFLPDADYSGLDHFTFVANDGQVDSAPVTISIEIRDPALVSEMHVASLDLDLISAGKNWKASASIMVVDQDGNPMPGAVVSGIWSLDGKTLESVSGLTDVGGLVVLTSSPVKVRSGSVLTFVLSDIGLDGTVYDADANVQSSASVTIP